MNRRADVDPASTPPARGLALWFLGGAGMVTGSRTVVTAPDGRRVLIDCGMFQGYKHDRLRNRDAFPFDPRALDAVLLTHAHLDHSGMLPALVRAGFRGPVYATAPTVDLLHLILPDSARIQEEDASFANRHGTTRHHPAEPLYTELDAARALELLVVVPTDHERTIGPFTASWHVAGHLLGAASIRVAADGASVLFSGDVGRTGALLVPDPSPPPAADAVVLESTYGDRHHAEEDPAVALGAVVRRTVARGGVLLVPAFAIGRAQVLLLLLHRLRRDGAIPEVPIVLDSPMAIDSTSITLRHLDATTLDAADARALHRGVEVTRDVQESKALHGRSGPFILISASGMLTGGRVLHHVTQRAGDPRNTILLAGFQAGGTRGARLLDGETSLRIHGQDVAIRCEVAHVDGLSAHADQDGLAAWVRAMSPAPRRVWINHGEPSSSDALRARLVQKEGVAAEVAILGGRAVIAPVGVAVERARAVELLGGAEGGDPLVMAAQRVAADLPAAAGPGGVAWIVSADAPIRAVIAPAAAAYGQRVVASGAADATIAFPGGYAALAEVFARLAAGAPTGPPLILVGTAFWSTALPIDDLVRSGVVGPDRGPPIYRVDDAQAAFAALAGVSGSTATG
jgi:metallo-beta-lactamase family protein